MDGAIGDRSAGVPRRRRGLRGLARSLGVTLAFLLAGCGGGDEAAAPAGGADAPAPAEGPAHVHGLAINPADGALYIATHSGLWRAQRGEPRSRRVGDVRHDLMGFTIAGADEFLASGHPDTREELPPLLGLQRSGDGGRSWQAVSLLGEADLHVLRVAGARIYGVDASSGRLLTSDDGGRAWEERTPPAAVLDLAPDPGDPQRLVATTEDGLFTSADTGRSWRPVARQRIGLLAWPTSDALYLVDGAGGVSRSSDGGRSFAARGSMGSPPEAFAAESADELYAAVHGGTVLMSRDGGASWSERARP